jgi:hypothetical protein
MKAGGALTSWEAQTEGLIRKRNERNERGSHSLEEDGGGLVRTGKGEEGAMGTHSLESAEGWSVKTWKGSGPARGTHFL